MCSFSIIKLIGHVSLKCLVNLMLTCLNHFVVTVKQKYYPLFHIMAFRNKGYATNGIRATVETLGPNWTQNAPTCFTIEVHVHWPWSCVGEAGTLAQKSQKRWPNTLSAQYETRACKYTGIRLFSCSLTKMSTNS